MFVILPLAISCFTLATAGGMFVGVFVENVLLNTTNTRAKARNLRRDPRISVTVFDGDDPYRYFEVEGDAELVDEGAEEHIEALSERYRGGPFGGPRDRVIVKVKPRRIFDYQ